MIFQVVLALSFAAVVLGDGCCTPDQWEGLEMAAGGYTSRTGRKGGINNAFRVSYDANGQKIAVSGKSKREGKKYKLIYDFQEGAGYFVFFNSEEESKCKTFELKKKFRKACIPDDAKVHGTSYLGAGEKRLNVKAYQVAFKGKRADVAGIVTVTEDGCIPVTEDWWGMVKGAGFFTNVIFAGITPGIQDPGVFSPPESCERVRGDLLEEEYDDFRTLRVSFQGLVDY